MLLFESQMYAVYFHVELKKYDIFKKLLLLAKNVSYIVILLLFFITQFHR